MPYIAASQIYGKIPSLKVTDALDDDGSGDPALIAAQLTQVIATASNAVDGLLQGRFNTPLPVPYPALVVDAALIFACEDLWGRRPIAEMKNPYKERADAFRTKLEKITKRELGLDAQEQEAITPGAYLATENKINTSMA